jgi:hypothetical protein
VSTKKIPGQQIARRYPPYLLARQIAALKNLSDDTETSVQYHIRQAIDELLDRRKKQSTDALANKMSSSYECRVAVPMIRERIVRHKPRVDSH